MARRRRVAGWVRDVAGVLADRCVVAVRAGGKRSSTSASAWQRTARRPATAWLRAGVPPSAAQSYVPGGGRKGEARQHARGRVLTAAPCREATGRGGARRDVARRPGDTREGASSRRHGRTGTRRVRCDFRRRAEAIRTAKCGRRKRRGLAA